MPLWLEATLRIGLFLSQICLLALVVYLIGWWGVSVLERLDTIVKKLEK